MIRIDELVVSFGGVRALDELTLAMPGQIVGLIGPNGAGKTTLLNVLSGFIAPDSGSVSVDDIDIGAMSPAARARWGVRRTFQSELVIDEMTVRDNIAITAENTHRGSAKTAVADVLRLIGLTNKADLRVGLLDSFERRLVEIGRAIVGSPKMTLMDEPGGGLGTTESTVLRDLILQIPEATGGSVLVVDHDIELIASTCGFTACLDFGSLIAAGPTREVLDSQEVKLAYLGIENSEAEL